MPALQLPAGVGAGYAVTLSLCGGLLNVSLGTASYEPSGMRGVWPPAVTVLPAAGERQLQFFVPVASADDAASYTAFALGGALCEGAQRVIGWAPPEDAPQSIVSAAAAAAGAVIRCNVTMGSLLAELKGDDHALLSVSVGWGGSLLLPAAGDVPVTVAVVVRPFLSDISPLVLAPGSVAVISGAYFCSGDWRGGSSSCYGSAAASMEVGAAPGTPAVQLWLEPAVANASVRFRYACADMQVLTDRVATCTPPALEPTLPGYPHFTATLTNIAGAPARARLNVTYPSASGFIRATASLPTQFLPSDASTPWLLPDDVVVEAVLLSTGQPFAGVLQCALAPRTPGVLLLSEREGADLGSVSGFGRVNFGHVGIQVPFAVSQVEVVASCSAPLASNVTGLTPLLWTLRPYPLEMTLCDPLPAAVQSLAPLPHFRVALSLANGTATAAAAVGIVGSNGTAAGVRSAPVRAGVPPQCNANRSFAAPFHLPAISCTVSVAGSNGTEAVLQGSSAELSRNSGQAAFVALSIGGRTGASFVVRVRCAVGSVVIPGHHSANLTLMGCAPGLEPAGPLCAPCGSGWWGAGAGEPCRRCPPRGAVCEGGLLRLLPGFYRQPAQIGRLLDETAHLYPCPFPERCLVGVAMPIAAAAATAAAAAAAEGVAAAAGGPVALNANSSAVAATHGCVQGAMGPLCALCDVAAGYTAVGGVCTPCPPQSASAALVAAAVIAFTAAVAYVALHKPPTDAALQRSATAVSIALRILLTHLQALAALRAFRTSGLTVFRALTAWTDALTPALLTEGPGGCMVQPSFAATFFGTLAAPLIASVLGLLMLAAAAVCCGRGSAASPAPAGGGSGSTRLRSASSLALAAAPAARRSMAGHASGCSGARERLRALWRSRDGERVLVVVLSVAYMSVVSVCISVLDCSEPIDDVRYLRADYSVECRGGAYTGLAAVAVLALLGVGLGFPLLIFLRLRRATTPALVQRRYAAWAFLYMGYRMPDGENGATAEACTAAAVAAAAAAGPYFAATNVLRRKEAAAASPSAVGGSGVPDASDRVDDRGSDSGSCSNALASTINPFAMVQRHHEGAQRLSQSRWVSVSAAAPARRALGCCCLRRPHLLSGAPEAPACSAGAGSASCACVCTSCLLLAQQCATCPAVISARAIAPGNRAFWEATVLLRKLTIVLLARLVSSALVQIAAFVVAMVLFWGAHLVWEPYVERRFAQSEGMSLLCLIVTACIAITAQPAAGVPEDAVSAVNVAMVAVNAATLAVLLRTWLTLCAPQQLATAAATSAAVRRRLWRRARASMGLGAAAPAARGVTAGRLRVVKAGAGDVLAAGTHAAHPPLASHALRAASSGRVLLPQSSARAPSARARVSMGGAALSPTTGYSGSAAPAPASPLPSSLTSGAGAAICTSVRVAAASVHSLPRRTAHDDNDNDDATTAAAAVTNAARSASSHRAGHAPLHISSMQKRDGKRVALSFPHIMCPLNS